MVLLLPCSVLGFKPFCATSVYGLSKQLADAKGTLGSNCPWRGALGLGTVVTWHGIVTKMALLPLETRLNALDTEVTGRFARVKTTLTDGSASLEKALKELKERKWLCPCQA